MRTVIPNAWYPQSRFLGQPAAAPAGTAAGNAIAASAQPPVVQFAPPTTYLYPPPGYVYRPGVYEVNTPPAPAQPAPTPSWVPWAVIGGGIILGVTAIALVSRR